MRVEPAGLPGGASLGADAPAAAYAAARGAAPAHEAPAPAPTAAAGLRGRRRCCGWLRLAAGAAFGGALGAMVMALLVPIAVGETVILLTSPLLSY